MSHTNNPTEQQAAPTSEEELRECIIAVTSVKVAESKFGDIHESLSSSQIDAIMQLIQQEIEKAKLEARLSELNNVCIECPFIHLDVDGETLSVTREERLQQLKEELLHWIGDIIIKEMRE